MMKKIFVRKKEGFTLIELLIVVAIIGILAGIAIPNFLGARTKAKVSRAFADMRTIGNAIEAYAVDNGEYPPASPNTGATSYVPTGNLTDTGLITSVPDDPFSGSPSTTYRYYTTGDNIGWVIVSNGPDTSADFTNEESDWTSETVKAGQLGGPESVVTANGSPWSKARSASDPGDLGYAGGNL